MVFGLGPLVANVLCTFVDLETHGYGLGYAFNSEAPIEKLALHILALLIVGCWFTLIYYLCFFLFVLAPAVPFSLRWNGRHDHKILAVLLLLFVFVWWPLLMFNFFSFSLNGRCLYAIAPNAAVFGLAAMGFLDGLRL